MIDEADPAYRVFQKHVHSFLEGLPSSLVEDVFRLERLVYWKIYRIVRVWHTRGRRWLRWLLFGVLRLRVGRRWGGALVATLVAALLHRRWDALVVGFAVPRHAALGDHGYT